MKYSDAFTGAAESQDRQSLPDVNAATNDPDLTDAAVPHAAGPGTAGPSAAVSGPARPERDASTVPAVRLQRSQSSFEEFYAAERDALVRVVALVEGSPVAAADVVDEAMVRAFQRWSHVSQLDRPAGWVYRVALNLGRSRFRRLGREVKYRWLMLPESDVDLTVEQAFRDRVADNRLISAVVALPVKQRAVVVARVVLGYTEAEVAETLEIPPGTVKSRLSRALAALRLAVPHLAPTVDRYVPDSAQLDGANAVRIRTRTDPPSVSVNPQRKGTRS